MKNIVWTRIDDRLVHGQVMTQWVQYTKANEVLIVDDAVAEDSFLQMVMKASMPSSIALKVQNEKQAVNYLTETSKDEKIILLVKTPTTLDRLTDAGVELLTVNVGGIGSKAGRKKLYKNIAASEEERQAFRNLLQKGIDVFFQVIITESREDVKDYL